jgi:hypothetical protein
LVCCQMPFLFPCLLNCKLSVTSCAHCQLLECCWLLNTLNTICVILYVRLCTDVTLPFIFFLHCCATCHFTLCVSLVSMATCVLDKDISLVNINVLSVFRLSDHTVISLTTYNSIFSTKLYTTSIILKSIHRFLNQSGFVPQKLEFIKPTVHT